MKLLQFALVVFFFSMEARGQTVCIDDEVGKNNLLHANQRPIFVGLSRRGHITEIWVNSETTEWTAVYILPEKQKKICIVDSGTLSKRVNFFGKKIRAYD